MSRAKNENKKKPVRVAAGPEAPGFARSLGENIGRFIRPLIPLAIFFVVGGGFSFLLWRSIGVVSAAGKDAADGIGYRLSERALRMAVLQKQRPQWISREDYEQVAAIGTFAANHSIFEPNLSATLAQKYKDYSPWVEQVKEVRLRYPAQVDVEIDWRKPAARVDRTMVLDKNGFVLNLMPDSAPVRDVPLITGVNCARTETGRPVREKELLDALQLMACVKDALDRSPGQLKVATLQRDASGQWRVVTDRGPYIFWGFFTDEPGMDEPRTQEKVDLLRRRLCEIKDPSLLEYIKVYTAQAPVKPRSANGAPENTSTSTTAATQTPTRTRH